MADVKLDGYDEGPLFLGCGHKAEHNMDNCMYRVCIKSYLMRIHCEKKV